MIERPSLIQQARRAIVKARTKPEYDMLTLALRDYEQTYTAANYDRLYNVVAHFAQVAA
jgi:hypothetical protein